MMTDLKNRTGLKTALAGVCALAVLAGCDELPGPQGGPSKAEMREEFLLAAESVGCVLADDRQYSAIDFQAGLTREQTLEITQFMLSRGKAKRIEGTEAVRITAGGCSA